MGPEKFTCEECRYWHHDKPMPDGSDETRERDYEFGQCRRHAPKPGMARPVWPSTSWNSWCGEFEVAREGD